MSESQEAVEAVVVPAAPVRQEAYHAATRAALEHIDGQAVRADADGRPEGTRKGYAEWLWTQPGWTNGTFTAPSTIDRRIPAPSSPPAPSTG
ncbi:hypothetical protein ACF08O_31620 [Streptomyces paradoxus]|uniref:hypothetical protein n=1 Tax=Streptomyces paradoxus TaxID=66375 RepID=UPI0036FD5B17